MGVSGGGSVTWVKGGCKDGRGGIDSERKGWEGEGERNEIRGIYEPLPGEEPHPGLTCDQCERGERGW